MLCIRLVFSGKANRLEGKVVAVTEDTINKPFPLSEQEDIVDIPFMKLNNTSRLESGSVEANFEIRS